MAQYKGASTDGFRAKTLLKKREKQKEEIEHLKSKISESMDQKLNVAQIDNKFASHYDAVEQQLKSNTIGLVTLDEMKAQQESALEEREKRLLQEQKDQEKEKERKRKNKEKEKTEKRSKLSFGFDEDEEEEEEEEDSGGGGREEGGQDAKDEPGCSSTMKRLGKNPDVDTSFLPDKEREQEERIETERLRQEWHEMQEQQKAQEIEVVYSYWDGSGHRKKCVVKQGDTIQTFLHTILRELRGSFDELKSADTVNLMYVKEDFIIPHHYTFHDFIVTKARGKTGPLFDFTAHEDVRITQDASVKKDESHAGKVCLRSWYEKNKHIYPASRWESFDSEIKW